ncbi:A24 family peptidase [Actinosynnema sp. NPDC023794]
MNALGTRDGFMVGSVVGVGLGVLHQRFDGVPHQFAVLWLAAIGVPLMMIDWACHRLPSPLVRALFVGGVAILGYVAASHDDLNALTRALLAAGITSAAALTVAMIIPAALGAGDVKLLGAVALYLGWVGWLDLLRGVVLALLLGAMAGTTLLIARRISRTDRLAFGPAIVGGALLALVAT